MLSASLGARAAVHSNMGPSSQRLHDAADHLQARPRCLLLRIPARAQACTITTELGFQSDLQGCWQSHQYAQGLSLGRRVVSMGLVVPAAPAV